MLQPGLRSHWEKRQERPLVGLGRDKSNYLGGAFSPTLTWSLLS